MTNRLKSLMEWKARDFKALATMLTISLVFLTGAGLMHLLGIMSVGSDGVDTGTEVAAYLDPDTALNTAALPPGVTTQPVEVMVSVEPAGFAEQLLVRSQVPMILVVILIVIVLRRMLLDVANGAIFTRTNAGRLRIVGLLLAAATLVDLLTQLAAAELASRTLPEDLVVGFFQLSFLPLGAGLFVLALAAVFDAGVRLREDSEGTI